MTDLDAMLKAMQALPADARLATMEDAVMRGVAQRQELTTARRSAMLAVLLAVGVGWAGSVAPAQTAQTAQASPLAIGMSDYAPSHLLGQ